MRGGRSPIDEPHIGLPSCPQPFGTQFLEVFGGGPAFHHHRIVLRSRPPLATPPVMAPKTKETALQRARRMEQKALALAVHGKAQMVTAALKKYPKVVENVFDLCKREVSKLGGDIEDLDREQTENARAPLAIANVPANTDPDGSVGSMAPDFASGPAGMSESPPAEDTHKRVDQLSSAEICSMLGSVEEIVFSKHALKALLVGNQRVVTKEPLLQLWEFVFAMNRGTRINTASAYRSSLLGQLREANDSNGRRASTLRLPPNWKEQGVYALLHTAPPVVKVLQRFTGATRVVPEGHLVGINCTKLYIANNFSDDSAYLAVEDGILNLPLNILFSKERMEGLLGSGRKRRKVIGDMLSSDALGEVVASSLVGGGGSSSSIASVQDSQANYQNTTLRASAAVDESMIVPPPPPQAAD